MFLCERPRRHDIINPLCEPVDTMRHTFDGTHDFRRLLLHSCLCGESFRCAQLVAGKLLPGQAGKNCCSVRFCDVARFGFRDLTFDVFQRPNRKPISITIKPTTAMISAPLIRYIP